MQAFYQTKFYALLFIFLFAGININHAQVTWLGGSSNWNIAANWDTGTIPTAADEVVIPSGVVYLPGGYQGFATHVEIATGAKLHLRVNSELYIAGAFDKAGIQNDGNLNVYGLLEIQNITETPAAAVANGISNEHIVFVGKRGTITIHDTDNNGIQLGAGNTCKLTNKGSIFIEDCIKNGIYSDGKINNYGNMDIIQSTFSQTHAIILLDHLKNYEDGVIVLTGGEEGLATGRASVIVKNWGSITSYSASQRAFRNSGSFFNYESGILTAEDSGLFNFYNNGIFTNYGSCHFWGSNFYGIGNVGEFINNNHISLSQSYLVSFFCYLGSVTDNHGSIHFSDLQNIDLGVEGTFINHNDGVITQHNKFDFRASGVFENHGILKGFGDRVHLFNAGAIFENHGLIDDNFDNFRPIVDNQQVIVSPINDPLKDGVAYSPGLTIAALDKVTIGEWKTSNINGIVCGTYDKTANSFTPNVHAVGLTKIYLTVTIDASSVGTYTSIALDSAVAPFTGKGPKDMMAFRKNEKTNASITEDKPLNFFPNPTSGMLNIEVHSITTERQLQISNSLGQAVYQQMFSGHDLLNINLPSNLSDGFYFINIFEKGKLLESRKFQLVR